MFANDKSIDNLESLFKEVRKYIELQGQYVKLDLVEKLTILLSTLILILIIIILSMMALFYFSFMLVYALAPLVGSLIGGYAIIGGVVLLLAILIYRMRKQWIFQPMVHFLARLFSVEIISQLRAQKKQELRESKERIQLLTQELFSPQKSKNKMENMMQHINAGIAAYDGLKTGIMIFQRIHRFFNRKKDKNR